MTAKVYVCIFQIREEYRRFYDRVCTGYGKPGKSWNLRISFCRPEKSWNLLVGHGKSWKILKSIVWWISYCR